MFVSAAVVLKQRQVISPGDLVLDRQVLTSFEPGLQQITQRNSSTVNKTFNLTFSSSCSSPEGCIHVLSQLLDFRIV